MSRWPIGILLLSVGLIVFACDESTPVQVESGEGGAEEFDEEETAQEEAAMTAFEGAHDQSVAVETAGFDDALVEGICLAYENCQNQDFQMALFSLFVQAMAQETAEDGEAHEAIPKLMERLQESNEIPSHQECTTIFGLIVEEFGLDGESLDKKIAQGTLEFDSQAAGRCISRFGIPFDLCAEERQLSSRMEAQEFVAMMTRHQQNLDEHFQVCGTVFTGQSEVGAACEFNYECAGDNQCGEDDDGAQVCMSSQAVSGGGFLP